MPKLRDRESHVVTATQNKVMRAFEYKSMSKLDLVRSVRQLFKHRKWCQGCNAANASGLPVSPLHPDAVEWCLRGACIKVLEPSLSVLTVDMHNPASNVSKFIADAFGFTDSRKMVQWNDTQGRIKDEIIELCKQRIKEYRRDATLEEDDTGEAA